MKQACRRWQRRLSLYVDGQLGPRAARRVEQHLAGCPLCRAGREELLVLADWAAALGSAAPPAAGERGGEAFEAIWSGIERQLEVQDPAARRAASAPRSRWGLGPLGPALAGAALVTLVGGSEARRQLGRWRAEEALDRRLQLGAGARVRAGRERAARLLASDPPGPTAAAEADVAPDLEQALAEAIDRQDALDEASLRAAAPTLVAVVPPLAASVASGRPR